MGYRILAIDPGAKNYAYAIVTDRRVVAEIGMIEPIDNVIDLLTGSYSTQIEVLLDRYEPEYCIIERYMYRGASSVDAENVNLMVGVLVENCIVRGIKTYLVSSAEWKNFYRRTFNIPKGEKVDNRLIVGETEGNIHQRDAISLGYYAIDRLI